jgi:uncharacterized membrane protein YcaP (DUF421 family)
MQAFEWQRMFLGEDGSWLFLLEIVFRTLVMYIVMLVFFKISGKKEIKQLSIFDLILIVGLGSAAGDPMFYDDVPLLHGLAVFATILGLYTGIIYVSQKSTKVNEWLEGRSECVFENNSVNIKVLYKEGLNTAELFSELRQASVSHLGQVRKIYLEFSGEFSIYYHKDDEVVYGLPIYPEILKNGKEEITEPGLYSCVHCGLTKEIKTNEDKAHCTECKKTTWVKAINEKRIK